MNLQEIVGKVRSSEIPVGALAGAGIVLLLLSLRGGKGGSKLLSIIIAMALFGGAVWWHLQRR